MSFFRGYVKLPGSRWWFLLFLTYVLIYFHPWAHGEMIHFDYTIFFRRVGSTTNYIYHPLISFPSRNIWTQKIPQKIFGTQRRLKQPLFLAWASLRWTSHCWPWHVPCGEVASLKSVVQGLQPLRQPERPWGHRKNDGGIHHGDGYIYLYLYIYRSDAKNIY